MIFDAYGIPKENIKHGIEFINKTRQTFLNVCGRKKIKDLEFENHLNIHMLINTDIYEGYEVNVSDGMVMIILREILNEAPQLRDYSRERFMKNCE